MGKLDGKIALVTGGNSGIGLATAKEFAGEGAYVFITGRRDPELAAAVKEIGSNVTAVRGDVSNLGDLDRLFAEIQREKGRLDVQHDVYRPYYYDRFAAGLDAHGKPVTWSHRIVGPSIMARFLPPGFKDGIDIDAVDGAVQLLYDIPAIQIEYVRHEEPVLNTGFWRGVGVTHNNFVIESFIDELAAASRQDPVAFRRALLGKSPRAMAVLDLAAKEAGWGKPLPRGHGRGVALLYSGWGTYLAQVADVEVTGSGDVRVHRIVCAVDCGRIVNPDIVRAQIESGVVYGISAALWGEVTLKNGRVEQSNFHNYRVLRMNESPPIEVHLVRNSEAPGGIGEPGSAATAPALGNAIFAATGKRIRKLPLQPGL